MQSDTHTGVHSILSNHFKPGIPSWLTPSDIQAETGNNKPEDPVLETTESREATAAAIQSISMPPRRRRRAPVKQKVRKAKRQLEPKRRPTKKKRVVRRKKTTTRRRRR